jgi:superfamily II DNA or RNA helicase
MEARPHQIEAKAAVVADYDAGHRQLLVSMATGTGKSFFFSDLYNDLVSRLPGKMLVLAHTEELVDQNIKTLELVHPDKKIDKEMAEHKADPSTADIIVASVASLGRKGTSRVLKYNWDEWDKVIIDEAHHTPAGSYRNIIDCSGVARPGTSKLLLGVTATTRRADGQGLEEFYKRISYAYGLYQAINDGWLVDIRGYRVETEVDLDSVKSSNGDFNLEDLADKINNPIRNARVADAWEKLAENRRTVIFAANIAHAQALAKEFQQRGHKFEAIWGDDPDREAKLAAHKNGELNGLINVGVLIEGYDDWQIGCIVIACPTQSECKFTQMCGRVTRLQEGTGNLLIAKEGWTELDGPLKTDGIIIDVADTTSRHTLMSVPTLMGLPAGLDLGGRSLLEAKKKLDQLQEDNPQIDFTKLKSIDQAADYIEQINMFEVRFPAEVEANSDYKWYKTVEGGFRLRVPGPVISNADEPVKRGPEGVVDIHQNMLGKWEVSGQIKNEQFHGVRDTMESAFVAADNAVRERAAKLLTLINRKADWHDQPMKIDGSQHNLLKKLYPGKQWPTEFTKGQASHFIDQKLQKRRKA